MGKSLLVARHEFLTNVRRKGFLFATIGVPALTIGLLLLVMFVIVEFASNDDIGTVGYVDQSGLFADADAGDSALVALPDIQAAEAAFEARAVSAYFVIAPDYLQTGRVQAFTRSGLPEGVQGEFNRFLATHLSAGVSGQTAERLLDPVTLSLHILDSGRTMGEDAVVVVFILPLLFMMIFMIALQSAGSYLISGVVEEKSNRIMEILITSITPGELLRGKILGLGLLALLQVSIWVAAAVIGLQLGQGLPALSGVALPADLVILSFAYFILAFFLNAAIMAAIGAVVTTEQESRQISGLFSFLLVIPIFFLTNMITDPNGPIPIALTLIPFTAPVAGILRMGISSVPLEQIVLSMVILAATAVAAAWVGGRIFGWSLLMYGKRPSLRAIIRAVRRGERMQTAATEAQS